MESDRAMISPGSLQLPKSSGDELDRTDDRMEWDISVVDKLLYKVNAIVLLACGVLILLLVKPVTPPQKSINCFCPAEFDPGWVTHAERLCLSKNATLYDPSINSSAPDVRQHDDTNEIDIQDIFPGQSLSSSIFSSRLFLMAILSLGPFLLWRVIGSFDGRVFISQEGSIYFKQTIIILIWFLITKLAAALLCGVFVYVITTLRADGDHYLNVLADNHELEEISLACDFRVRRLGQNIHRYTVGCIISKGGNEASEVLNSMLSSEHILSPMLFSLQIWLYLLLVVTVLNLLATTALGAMCSMNSYRSDFIKRRLCCPGEQAIYDKMGLRLGTTGMLVLTLASGIGHERQVRGALNDLYQRSFS